MTQEELARAAGVSQVTIQHLESGRNKSSRKLVDIARALGVSSDWLGASDTKTEPIDSQKGEKSGVRNGLASYKYEVRENSEEAIPESYKELASRIKRLYLSGDLNDEFIAAIQMLVDCQESAKNQKDLARLYHITSHDKK